MNPVEIESIVEALDQALTVRVTQMMKDDFDIDVSLIKDPITEEISLMNLDGSNLSEEQFYALLFFQRGWVSALQTVGNLGDELDADEEVRYPDPEDDNND
jgi:hypothetical protein